jgi:tetratricopeptide (TPR) repeat protein
LAELARALGLIEQTETTGVAVSRLLGALQERDRWLLIYDNAEQPPVLAPFLPGGAGHVVITSRHPDWQELATPLPVDLFDRIESINLLRQRLPQLTEDDAGQVADALDNLPLALTQAAAYLQETGLSAQKYLRLLTHRASAILAQGVSVTYGLSLAASLHLAFDRLGSDEPAALALLRLAAQLAPEPIPFTLFTTRPDRLPPPLKAAAADPLAFAEVTGVLRRRALARVGPDSLQVHRLVQAILRDNPVGTTEDDMARIARQVLIEAAPADPWNNPASWPAWRQLLPHILTVTDPNRGAKPEGGDVPWLLDRAGLYLHARGEPRAARPLFERAHQLYRDILGEDHLDTLVSVNHLADDLHALGEYEQARDLFEDILTRRRQVLGEDHLDTLCTAICLTLVLRGLGEHSRARDLDADTLTRYRQILDDDHPHTLRSANSLAADLRELGEHEQARDLAEDTLTRSRRVLGDDHPHTLRSAQNLTLVLHELGEHEQARDLAEDTLTRSRRVLGDDHPYTLRSAQNLTLVLRELGEHKRARDLAEDTLTRSRRVLGDNHPYTLATANNFDLILYALRSRNVTTNPLELASSQLEGSAISPSG